MRRLGRLTAPLLAMLLLSLGGASVAAQQQGEEIELDSPLRGIEIDYVTNRVDFDLVLYNHTDQRRVVRFELEDIPEGWTVAVWNRLFNYRITEFIVEPSAEHPGRRQEARLRINPPADPEPGEYRFSLRVLSQDGAIEYENATYTLRVREEPPVEPGGVSLRAEIPILRGAPGTTFNFEVLLVNDTEEEGRFHLAASVPDGWNVAFRETRGERQVIREVSTPEGLDDRLRVEVRVPSGTPLGAYEFPVTATGDVGNAEVTLRVELTGRGDLRATTPDGRTRVDAQPGQEGTGMLRLVNPGTDVLEGISLGAETPGGGDWVVEFGVPGHVVPVLPANNQIDIPVTVTPPDDVPAGDYRVTVRASHPRANASVDYRVTVTRPGIWDWMDILVVVLVVGGAMGLLMRWGWR